MSPLLRALPLLAAVLLFGSDAAAQSAVQLTTLHANYVTDGHATQRARLTADRPLASGDVRIWASASPVFVNLPAADEPATSPVAKTGLPTVLALGAPYPNPAAGRVAVPFEVPEATLVRLLLYDALGREVAVLADGDHAAGRHQATVPAADLAPGVYVIRLVAGDAALVSRLTVVR